MHVTHFRMCLPQVSVHYVLAKKPNSNNNHRFGKPWTSYYKDAQEKIYLPLYTVAENINLYSMGVPQKNSKYHYYTIQRLHFWIYISEGKITILKRYLSLHIHCSIVHNTQEVERTQVSING